MKVPDSLRKKMAELGRLGGHAQPLEAKVLGGQRSWVARVAKAKAAETRAKTEEKAEEATVPAPTPDSGRSEP